MSVRHQCVLDSHCGCFLRIVIMKLVLVAAFVAACGAAKLDRTYLPPASSQTAGGVPVLFDDGVNHLLPGLQTPFQRTNDNSPSQGNRVPVGSYENDHQGVVVDAAAPGTRASNQPTGLGGSRDNYGSTDSKVGEAAFRGTKNQNAPTGGNSAPQDQTQPLGPASQTTGQLATGNDFKLTKDNVSPVTFVTDKESSSFSYGFETENGIRVAADGTAGKTSGMSTEGGYSYVGDDGKVYSISYTADEGGFRPTGSHLPTPPPVPAEIAEALQQNAKDEANGIYDDGSYDAHKYNAEEDGTRSDANGGDNDKQSNRFGVRPGFDSGRPTFINQPHQSFVNPNVQGQFNSYFANSPTPPVGTTFVTGFPGFSGVKPYNTFPWNQFRQPGLNLGVDPFFYQGQQGFVRPNFQGQFSSYDFSNKQNVPSRFGLGVVNIPNKVNNLVQNGQNVAVNNAFGFGSQFQYLPPIAGAQNAKPLQEKNPSKDNIINYFTNTPSFLEQNISNQGTDSQTSQPQYLPPAGTGQDSKPLYEKDSSKSNVNSNNAPSISGQKIQNQASAGKPFITQTKPNSYETTDAGQGFLNIHGTPSNQEFSSISNYPQDNANTPQVQEQFFQSGVQSSLIPDNVSSFAPTPIINNGIASNQENEKHPQNQETTNQIGVPVSSDSKDKNTNLDFSSVFTFSTSSLPLPTKQPELLLTTPLENQQGQTNSASSELGSTFNNNQQPNSINVGNTQSFLPNNPQQSGEHSNALPEQAQAQAPDSSYIYKKPSKPFNSISTQPNSNTISGLVSSQLNSAIKPFGSSSSNKPDSSIFSTQNQGSTGSTKNPQPPSSIPITPTSATSKEIEAIFQNNGITQASISSFPLITPTSPSKTIHSGEIYEYTKPAQGLPISTEEENINNSESIPEKEKYPTKPQFNIQSNTFGQQTIPPRFGVQTSSSFELAKPIAQLQSKPQGASTFGQKPVTSPFEVQTSFGVKPVQQQVDSQSSFFGAQTTPPHLNSQTVNQQTTQPQSGIQIGPIPSAGTSPQFGGQSKPPRLGGQTSSLFGPRPTQSQRGESSLGSQTTPSRGTSISLNQGSSPFGLQSSSTFGTPSRFGSQTSSTFGYKPVQFQPTGQTSFSFGSQTTPSFVAQTVRPFNQQTTPSPFGSSASFATQSRFGSQTGLTIEQKPTQPQLTGPINSIFGSKTKPTRLGEQTTSHFGQKPKQQQPCGVCGSQSGSRIPSRFVGQTSTSLNKQTTSSFSIPSRFGAQSTFGQKPSQSQVGAQATLSQTTPSRFETRPITSFASSLSPGQRPTPSSFGIQTGTLFGQKPTLPSFNVQTGSSFGQQTTTAPFGSQKFGQKITPSQFDDSSSKQQSTQQYENKLQENENLSESKPQSQTHELNDKFETQTDSTLLTTSVSQIETIRNGEIYQYNKPTNNFATNLGKKPSSFGLQQAGFNGAQGVNINKEDGTSVDQQTVDQTDERFGNKQPLQFGIQPNIQLGQEIESITSQKPHVSTQFDTQSDEETFSTPTQNQGSSQSNVQSQVSLFPRFPEQEQQKVTSLTFGGNKPSQFVAPTSTSEDTSDGKEFTNTQFSSSSTESSGLNSQSTLNLQNKDQQQNTQSGEIYQYNKPTQSLPVPEQQVNNRFGQNTIPQSQFPTQSSEITVNPSKLTTLSQSNEKFVPNQAPTQSSEQQSELTQDTQPSSKPSDSRPSFYSACCRDFKPSSGQGLFSNKVSDTRLNANYESNIGNKNNQGSSGSGPKDNKFTGFQDFGIQKDTPIVNGKGEQFGGPRDPPRFDNTGYHY